MYRKTFGLILAGALTTATLAAQQSPPAPPPAQPGSPQPTPSVRPGTQIDRTTAMVTVEGCLVREADVPGRQPNVAERAGVTEDYILTNTRMVSGTAPSGPFGLAGSSAPLPGAKPEAGASATAPGAAVAAARASGPMYEVEGLSGDQLKTHLNQRVQIDGRFENLENARPQGAAPSANANLVELRASGIRKVDGQCPAPSPAK